MHKHGGNVSLEEIKHFLIDSSLYSLQAVILEQLLNSAHEGESSRKHMRELSDQIAEIYRTTEVGRFLRIKKPLTNLWLIREMLAKWYLKQYPDTASTLKNVFSRIVASGITGDDRNAFLTEYLLSNDDLNDNTGCCGCAVL